DPVVGYAGAKARYGNYHTGLIMKIMTTINTPRRELADLIRQHIDSIMEHSLAMARHSVTGAKGVPRLVPVDFLAETLNEFADEIEQQYQEHTTTRAEVATHGAIHGGARAAVPHYD